MPSITQLHPTDRPGSRARGRSRGQVAVMFALSITLFVALCAIVVDISFYWVATLRVQRAADAAALAGAVYLPGDTTTAYSVARTSATENGYPDGGDVTVTPVQDAGDPRQLDVTISANVPAFFARVVGITSFPVTRAAKGVYVLPVPMGSPLAYYGVGDFSVNTVTTVTNPHTDVSRPGYTSSSGAWSSPERGWLTGTSASRFTTSSSNGQRQAWTAFNIPSISGSTLDGLVVSFNAKVSTASSACRVQAELSWNGGSSWANVPLETGTLTTGNNVNYTLGSASALAAWGNNHTWAAGDFANNRLQVRLTYLKGSGCGTLSLNTMLVTVHSHTVSTTSSMTTTHGVSDGGTFLASQGGWGAIITKGGNEQNGDAYAPANNGGYAPANNAKYDASGYMYVTQLPSGGTVKVFDPGFCAMGSNGVAGSMGAGDHWIGSSGTPVSTYYTLWNTNGKVGLPAAWTQVYTSGTKFENQKGYDPANTAPNVADGSGPSGATDSCDVYHNTWWTLPTGALGGGTYVLQVQTSKTRPPASSADASINDGTNAENMWAIEIVGSGANVYGNGRMTVYNNLQASGAGQQFYLAKIDQVTGIGKTALIDLFDPGDLGSGANGVLQIFSPDGGTPHAVTFDYTTDGNCVAGRSDDCSGTGVSQIQTSKNGSSSFNNTWIHISTPLGNTYGQAGGLWQGGWWQIVYTTPQGGNDTTTWQVSVVGNPVHLLVP